MKSSEDCSNLRTISNYCFSQLDGEKQCPPNLIKYLRAIRSLALPSLLDKLPELETRGSLLKGPLEPVRLQLEMS